MTTAERDRETDILYRRKSTHGPIEETFVAIGRSWGALLSIHDIPPKTVALMMAALKGVRAQFGDGTHADHYTDIDGYTRIAERLACPADRGDEKEG